MINTLENFLNNMDKINSIGFEEGQGVTRLALSKEDMKARDCLIRIFKDMGLAVKIDSVGNIRAIKEGRDKNLSSVMVGSHIDTVPNGGKFDGLLGVVAGIEVLNRMIKKNTPHSRSIEVVIFSIEESSRFNFSTVGSKAMTGKIDVEDLKLHVDENGISIYEALIDRGYNPNNLKKYIINPQKIKAFLELHIEQGPILEKENIPIGIVEAIAAPIRLQIELEGEEAHSGGCPMNMRKDALVAASEIILGVEEVGNKEAIYKTVTTTGNCRTFPGAINVVPGKAELFVDIRGIDGESMRRALKGINNCIYNVSKKRNIKSHVKVLSREEPVKCSENMIKLIKSICNKLNIRHKIMASGAGHDTMNMSKVVPSALIFIPCKGGISHNMKEDVYLEHIKTGIDVLYETVLELAK
ncbi:M20 family metallo-hydrolase [Clostridium sp. MSJ-11]|uniref:M20 family metallo-hydrolase n=1 Tax=Clostridium mobile TaxID=2841512 RepID=A0ABS6EG33_9CLOT|nr:M20 family metallo-hydrolase [Clostridium mobile]MBU5483671.1 M20 family metallo-hydrolase [Clostridium mobile]